MKRREFTQSLLASVSTFVLIDSLFAFNALGRPVRPIADHWAIQLQTYCADLRRGSISATEWQQFVELLFVKIDIHELLRFIDFENLSKGFTYPDLGVNTKYVHFPKLEGLPADTAFVKKIFGMQKDRAIIPHGHANMASAHLILRGEMHLRHFEKIRSEEKHLVIKPTIDRMAGIGEASSISDELDNVHWFVANTPAAFTLDVIMLDLKNKPYEIYNLDINQKQSLSDGTWRVPMLDVETALAKYGKETHH